MNRSDQIGSAPAEASGQLVTEAIRRLGRDPRPRLSIVLERLLRPIDWLFNAVYTSQWNPLYKSGTLAVLFILVALVSGLYLFIFYSIGDPYGSVAELDATWHGSLMRSIHRYAADLAVIAAAIHAVKILMAGRTWGPRALAWISGLLLLGALLLCGWTGLVMAWDVQGQMIAVEGARMLDLMPFFSEPISRSFSRPEAVGRSFFFMNLFLHVALPLGLAALFWVHSSRVARAAFFPPRQIWRYSLGLLILVSVAIPVPLPAPADLLAVPVNVPLDVFYAFWLPLARAASPGFQFLFWSLCVVAVVSVPWWWKPRAYKIFPSRVDEDRCAGCTQCYMDCPYEAISMVRRDKPSSLSEIVGRVDPRLCVSCGICIGSCAPMGVGPAQTTGRNQLASLDGFLAGAGIGPRDVLVVGCRFGVGADPRVAAMDNVVAYASGCSGSVHTSVLETLACGGAAGVFVLTCPERDCTYREGPKWLRERVYNFREAELKARVDRGRLRIASFAASESASAMAAIERFRGEVLELGSTPAAVEVDVGFECEPVDVEVECEPVDMAP